MLRVKKKKGFIALIAMLILAATLLTVGISASLGGISEVQRQFSEMQAAQAASLAQACLEEGLGRLKSYSWSNFSGSLSFGADSCNFTITLEGSNAEILARGQKGDFYSQLSVTVDQTLNILSWRWQ